MEHSHALYCSESCRKAVRLQQMREANRRRRERTKSERKARTLPKNPHTLRRCVICGKPFPALPGQRACSGVCAKERANKDRPESVRQISPEAEALARYVEEHY